MGTWYRRRPGSARTAGCGRGDGAWRGGWPRSHGCQLGCPRAAGHLAAVSAPPRPGRPLRGATELGVAPDRSPDASGVRGTHTRPRHTRRSPTPSAGGVLSTGSMLFGAALSVLAAVLLVAFGGRDRRPKVLITVGAAALLMPVCCNLNLRVCHECEE